MNMIDRLKLCWRILRAPLGKYMDHAERELPKPKEEMQALMNSQIKEMVLVFSTHGHSGFSANYAIQCLTTLLKFEPWGPLTGEDDEWVEVEKGHFQNKRCSHVFKDEDGKAYDIDGRIFREPDGACYTSSESRVYITFPYTPVREYVDVPGETDQ